MCEYQPYQDAPGLGCKVDTSQATEAEKGRELFYQFCKDYSENETFKSHLNIELKSAVLQFVDDKLGILRDQITESLIARIRQTHEHTSLRAFDNALAKFNPTFDRTSPACIVREKMIGGKPKGYDIERVEKIIISAGMRTYSHEAPWVLVQPFTPGLCRENWVPIDQLANLPD